MCESTAHLDPGSHHPLNLDQRPDCPHPPRCQALVDEKWRQAHNCVCRSGPALPSVAFRCLRQLETFPSNPSLVMPHPLCQAHANSWIKSCTSFERAGCGCFVCSRMTLNPAILVFDRMFEFRLINSPLNPGTEKVRHLPPPSVPSGMLHSCIAIAVAVEV